MRTLYLSKICSWLLVTFYLSKKLMVLLVCLAFVGQAMASTVMSYHMMSMSGMNNQEKSQDMVMMAHSTHDMASSTLENSEMSTEDCCNESCNCFAGGCSNIATFIEIPGNVPIISLSAKILSYSRLALSQQPASLYRPPIFS